MEARSEVVGAVLHEECGEFCIQPSGWPSFRNADDTRRVFPKKLAKAFDIFGKNDAALGEGKGINLRIGKAGQIQFMRDVFDIKVFIEPGEVVAG